MKKRKKKGLPVWAVVVGVLLLIGAFSPSKPSDKSRSSAATRDIPAAAATAEPTPSPVPTPSPEPTETPEPTATPYRIHGVRAETTVYVSRNGVIHFKSTCSGMKYYETMTMEQADAAGYSQLCDHCR